MNPVLIYLIIALAGAALGDAVAVLVHWSRHF